MKVLLALAALGLWTTGNTADVVYIQSPEEMKISVRALDIGLFRQETRGYARAAGLKARPSGEFELRIWRIDAMTGDGVGYVLRNDQTWTFDITRRGGSYTTKPTSTRTQPLSGALASAARDVSLLAGYEYSCGIMDGESVLVEASLASSLYELWAGNPDSCADNSSKRIASLVRLANAAAHQSKP
jgi:hypothetical protein